MRCRRTGRKFEFSLFALKLNERVARSLASMYVRKIL